MEQGLSRWEGVWGKTDQVCGPNMTHVFPRAKYLSSTFPLHALVAEQGRLGAQAPGEVTPGDTNLRAACVRVLTPQQTKPSLGKLTPFSVQGNLAFSLHLRVKACTKGSHPGSPHPCLASSNLSRSSGS